MSTNKIIIKSVSEQGRWRAGRKFTRAGETLDIAGLSQEDLDAIRRDPLLQVIGELPETATKHPAGQDDLCYRVLKPFKYKGEQIEPTAGEDNAPVSIQLDAKAAKKLAAGGFISTAEGDVSLPPAKVD